MIWFSSDLHFCHTLSDIYESRGFSNIDDMNQTIIDNWNRLVHKDDVVYLLGDIMLSDDEKGLNCFRQLNGIFHIILGNHDTLNRAEKYKEEASVVEVVYATQIRYNGFHFYLSHYPTFTGHMDSRPLKGDLISLYGHTHQKTNFYIYVGTNEENIRMYHVGLDSHQLCPVSADEVVRNLCEKAKESGVRASIPKTIQTEQEKEREKEKQKKRKEERKNLIKNTIVPEIVIEEYQKIAEKGKLPKIPQKKDMQKILFVLPEKVIERYEKENAKIFAILGKEKNISVGRHILPMIKEYFNLD